MSIGTTVLDIIKVVSLFKKKNPTLQGRTGYTSTLTRMWCVKSLPDVLGDPAIEGADFLQVWFGSLSEMVGQFCNRQNGGCRGLRKSSEDIALNA